MQILPAPCALSSYRSLAHQRSDELLLAAPGIQSRGRAAEGARLVLNGLPDDLGFAHPRLGSLAPERGLLPRIEIDLFAQLACQDVISIGEVSLYTLLCITRSQDANEGTAIGDTPCALSPI